MLYTIETFFQGKKVSNVAFNVLKRDFQWLQLSFAEAFSFKSRIFEKLLLYIIGKYMPNYKHYQHIFAQREGKKVKVTKYKKKSKYFYRFPL